MLNDDEDEYWYEVEAQSKWDMEHYRPDPYTFWGAIVVISLFAILIVISH